MSHKKGVAHKKPGLSRDHESEQDGRYGTTNLTNTWTEGNETAR